jgi:O-antigen ligase
MPAVSETRSGGSPLVTGPPHTLPSLADPSDLIPIFKSITLALAGVIAYVMVITTSRFPGGFVGVALGLVGLAIQGKRLWLPAYLRWLFALMLWGLFSVAWSLEPQITMEWISEKPKIFVIMLLALSAVRTPRQLFLLVGVFLLAFLLYPARGMVLNYLRGITYGGRIALSRGLMANPNEYAAAAMAPLSMCVALLARGTRSKWLRAALISAVGLLACSIAFTESRGAFLAIACFMALVISRSRHRARALFGIAIATIVVLATAPEAAWTRLGGLAKWNRYDQAKNIDPEGSADARLAILRTAMDIIKDHPVLGTGMGTFQTVATEYNPAHKMLNTHNTYVNVFCDLGLVGLILFLGMLAAPLRYANARARAIEGLSPRTAAAIRLCGAGLIAFLVAAIWGTFPYYPFLHLHIVVLLLMARIWPDEVMRLSAASTLSATPRLSGNADQSPQT